METIESSKNYTVFLKKKRIAFLNDQLRIHGIGGKVLFTSGVADLGEGLVSKIIRLLREYTSWDKDNDPYDEHDFGIIRLSELKQKVYFKIDYYDERMEFGSEDPSDPRKTTRVLTIMLAEEY